MGDRRDLLSLIAPVASPALATATGLWQNRQVMTAPLSRAFPEKVKVPVRRAQARMTRIGWMRGLAAALILAQPATARAEIEGRYRTNDGPDVVGLLEIAKDGRFRYQLIAGALDQAAQGRWEKKDGLVRLFTEPKPTPPTFRITAVEGGKDKPLARVTWLNGRGIAGIDVRVGFSSGEPVEGYTQEDGWTLPLDESRTPIWIEIAEPIHRIASERSDLLPGQVIEAIFVPNDLGIVAFDGALVEESTDGVVLHHPWGDMQFIRQGRR